MTESTGNERDYTFKPVQGLGPPKIEPVIVKDRQYAVTQFLVLGLEINDSSLDRFKNLARLCDPTIVDVVLTRLEEKKTKRKATQVDIGFQFASIGSKEDDNIAMDHSLKQYDRFLGLLSFSIGKSVRGGCWQTWLAHSVQKWTWLARPTARASVPKSRVDIPDKILRMKSIPEWIFSALLWLRRGLAERDPIYTYSALMVCLEILAWYTLVENWQAMKGSMSGTVEEHKSMGPTSRVTKLIVEVLGEDPELARKLIKTRNAVVAHGGKPITADVLISLTDLKMDAGRLAFNSLKLALGLKLSNPPSVDQSFFLTDALMYLE